MSYQAVSWAQDDAPTLLTEKGKPDTTAHAVLVALAEPADEHGRGSRPSVLRLHYRTRFDERTIQRALDRLENGKLKLIKRTGVDRFGVVCWDLDMSQVRPADEWDNLVAEADKRKRVESEARAARRARANEAASGTQNPGHIDSREDAAGDVRDLKYRRPGFKVPASGTQNPGVRDATPPEPPVNHPGNHPSTIPGGAPPPGPRRTEAPTGPRTESGSTTVGPHLAQAVHSDHPLGVGASQSGSGDPLGVASAASGVIIPLAVGEPVTTPGEPASLHHLAPAAGVNAPPAARTHSCPHGRNRRRCTDCRPAKTSATTPPANATTDDNTGTASVHVLYPGGPPTSAKPRRAGYEAAIAALEAARGTRPAQRSTASAASVAERQGCRSTPPPAGGHRAEEEAA